MASVWSLLTSANETSTKILKKCHVETETKCVENRASHTKPISDDGTEEQANANGRASPGYVTSLCSKLNLHFEIAILI